MEDYVSFEISKKLSEKGFDWEPREIYELNPFVCRYEDYPRPTIAEVLKWLREEKRLVVEINCNYTDYFPNVRIIDIRKTDYISGRDIYNTYEEAALAGIEYVLDNLI